MVSFSVGVTLSQFIVKMFFVKFASHKRIVRYAILRARIEALFALPLTKLQQD
ncbi:hypothetical protein OH773_21960 (plasmid) [Buttiauxella sp. WJP83]|uniref:hypothetical protein n=1 Tax=Buttiauxella sp. WJP83 TaxID=2986951 RepID=UPI0022DD1ADA|nr:hypothetical protein [Buttiauxella sp. WJP83]WBM73030.1 hypothetical protein OH773_21960 [Buttiauxella sp. WJP83]